MTFKHKKLHIQSYHVYLGLGSIVSIVALVLALTVGLSSANYVPPM